VRSGSSSMTQKVLKFSPPYPSHGKTTLLNSSVFHLITDLTILEKRKKRRKDDGIRGPQMLYILTLARFGRGQVFSFPSSFIALLVIINRNSLLVIDNHVFSLAITIAPLRCGGTRQRPNKWAIYLHLVASAVRCGEISLRREEEKETKNTTKEVAWWGGD
jgi:hypothetical protein